MQIGSFAVKLICISWALLMNAAVAMPTLSPFINELHYDNAGSDRDEFIEVAGTPQSLRGFSLVLYNGGSGTSYRNIPLDADIPDEGNGFGAVAFFVNGLQHGPADGIALLDQFDRVLDWLSYEGAILGQNGAVMGLLSDAIDVFEAPATLPGLSLQRSGLGSMANDFGWVGPVASSPGTINAGQRWAVPVAINEPHPLPLLGIGLLLVWIGAYRNALNSRRREVNTGSV